MAVDGRRSRHVLAGIGAVAVAGAVAISAVTSHAALSLSTLCALDRAATMMAWHGLALGGIGAVPWQRRSAIAATTAAWLIGAGMVLFAGSVIAAACGLAAHAVAAPAGGMAMIAGWLVLALGWVLREP